MRLLLSAGRAQCAFDLTHCIFVMYSCYLSPTVQPDGRLPDASKDAKHIRDIFYRMGFDDREIVSCASPVSAHVVSCCGAGS